jgi:hypothetical protein
MIQQMFSILTCLGSIGSAYFWIKSALVKIPRPAADGARSEAQFAEAKAVQARLNGRAALLAGATALLQAIAISLRGFGISN